MNRLYQFTGLLLLVGMLAGCSSSYITSSWKNEKATAAPFRKILVLGLVRDEDRRLQQQMEEHLANDLRDHGYTAVTSLAVFGPKAFEHVSEKEALASLQAKDIDAVITVVLLKKTEEKVYVPNGPRQQGNFWTYYDHIYSRIYTPGYWVTDTKYYWESNLYRLGSNELVYSVQTQSFDPSSTEGLAHEYGQMIFRDMVKRGVISNQASNKKGF